MVKVNPPWNSPLAHVCRVPEWWRDDLAEAGRDERRVPLRPLLGLGRSAVASCCADDGEMATTAAEPPSSDDPDAELGDVAAESGQRPADWRRDAGLL